MAKTSTYTVPIRVDTSALHRQLEHLGRTYQDVADAYFRAAQKVLEDASPEPELDTSDLADPEPSRVEIHNYPPNPGEWGDMLRAGTFADEPAHDRDSRTLCRSMLPVDSVGTTHRWVIGCSLPLDHEGGHEGRIAWHRSEGL